MKTTVLLLLASSTWNSLLGEDKAPKPSVIVMSSYPRLALIGRLTGDVKLVVETSKGAPKTVQVESGASVLAETAANTVRKWRFDPAMSDTVFRITFRFEIVGTCPSYGCDTEFEFRDGLVVIRTSAHKPYIN